MEFTFDGETAYIAEHESEIIEAHPEEYYYYTEEGYSADEALRRIFREWIEPTLEDEEN